MFPFTFLLVVLIGCCGVASSNARANGLGVEQTPSLLASHDLSLPDVGEIQGDPVLSVLPRDAIPSIDNPKFVTTTTADFMKASEPVVGVEHRGIAKAYSLWQLDRHEIVNDEFGELPVAVTW